MGEILGLDEVDFLEQEYGEHGKFWQKKYKFDKIKHTGYHPKCCGKKMINEGYDRGHWTFACKKCGRKKWQCD